MRAVLCLRPPSGPAGAPAARWAPETLAACRATSARVEVGPDMALYCALAAPSWQAQVASARALLARVLGDSAAQHAGSGLARARFPAACAAATAAPGTLRVIPPDQERAALAPLPLTLLPALSEALRRDLRTLRVFTLGDLAALPPAVVRGVFGPRLLAWQALARGDDPQPVRCAGTADGFPPGVRRPLARQAAGRVLGLADLAPLTADLAATLAADGRAAASLEAMVGFVDGSAATRTVRLAPPAATAEELGAAAWPLVAAALRTRRRRPAWLALTAPHTTIAAIQPLLPLPPPAAEAPARLATAITAIQQRYGPHSIGYGLPACL